MEYVFHKLQEEFLNAKISIVESASNWGKFNVKIAFEDAHFDECLFPPDDSEWCQTSHGTVESLLSLVKEVYGKVQYILQKVTQKYNFPEFKFDRYSDDYGNDSFVVFRYQTPYNTYESKTYYTYNSPDDFIAELEEHFVTKLEGICEVRDDDGYFDDYYVDGTPVRGLIQRAKKVRIEILELK